MINLLTNRFIVNCYSSRINTNLPIPRNQPKPPFYYFLFLFSLFEGEKKKLNNKKIQVWDCWDSHDKVKIFFGEFQLLILLRKIFVRFATTPDCLLSRTAKGFFLSQKRSKISDRIEHFQQLKRFIKKSNNERKELKAQEQQSLAQGISLFPKETVI